MDREGAETYLRLLAEAAMRGSLAPAAAPRAPNASTMMVVGHALTAVGALDPVTAEEILTDFRLAVSLRQLHSEPGQGPGQAVTVAQWLTQGRAVLRPKQHPARSPGEGAPGAGTPGDDAADKDHGRDEDRCGRDAEITTGQPNAAGQRDVVGEVEQPKHAGDRQVADDGPKDRPRCVAELAPADLGPGTGTDG